MKKKYLEDSTEDYSYVDQVVRKLYGCSDEQLLKELEEAEQNPPPVDFDIYPDEFDRIWDDIQAERQDTHVKKTGKVRRFTWKRAVAIAAAACLMVGSTCLVAWGTKTYFYREGSRGGVEGDVVFNNDMVVEKVNGEDEAFAKIKDILDIRVLKPSYMPTYLEFSELRIGNGYATIEFSGDGDRFYMLYLKENSESSVNYQSEGNCYTYVENKWIKKTIEVLREEHGIDNVRFEANVVNSESANICFGNIAEGEFIKIVENLYY